MRNGVCVFALFQRSKPLSGAFTVRNKTFDGRYGLCYGANMQQKVVAYYRVSRDSQGADGLGIAGQKTDVARFVTSNGYDLVGQYSEVETGKKHTLDNRPQLRDAITHARRSGALLVVAKLDRLLRSTVVHSLLKTSSIRFVACDNPHANELTIDILAAVAANEVREISSRTKKALAEKKADGWLLGSARPGAHQITAAAGLKGACAGAACYEGEWVESWIDGCSARR
jgi:DNA invertase Pin-like site-specific DNA recombinase